MRRTLSVATATTVFCGIMVANPILASAAEIPLTTQDVAGLRAAVGAANATPEADTITLTAGARYTLDATAPSEDGNLTGDLDVTAPLTINGNGATLDAAGLDRFFDLRSGSLTLTNVVIVNGAAPAAENGGALRAAAGTTLTVTGGALRDNDAVNTGTPAATAGSGGAISTSGVLSVTGTTFSGNTVSRAGGAIELSAGAGATITGASFTGNLTGAAPGNGGALHLTGAATAAVTGSTFTGNTAAEGGALWNSAPGTLTVTGSTITGNTANGAAADQGGGGVFSEGGAVTITDTDVVGNAATGALGSGGGILSLNARLSVTGGEISGNAARRAGGGIEAGPLLTTTTPPVTGSTAPTTTTLDGVDLSGNSLVALAGTTPPRNGGGLHLTGAGTVGVTGSTVTGNTAAEGGGLWNSAVGVMTVTDSEISDNTADGALADQGGGGIFTEGGAVTIQDGTVAGNEATGAAGSGGGVLNVRGALTVTGTTISDNTAVRAGGGIESGPILLSGAPDPASPATSVSLTGVTLSANSTGTAPGNGGGLHLTGAGTTSVTDSTVTLNTAVEGGGLWNSAVGTMTVTGTEISGNTASGAAADQGGGGLYTEAAASGPTSATVTIADSSVTGNTATGAAGSGGGILNNQGTVTVTDSEISGNTAPRAGGGVEANLGSTTLDGVLLTDNDALGGTAPGNGGGLHLTGAGTVDVTGSTVSANTAVEGGGLWSSATGTTTLDSSTVNANSSSGPDGGGALYNDGGAFDVVNSTISGNTAAGPGGGLLSTGGQVRVLLTTVVQNSTGISGAVALGSSVVTGNTGASTAGAVTSTGGNVLGAAVPTTGTDTTGVADPRLGALADNGGPTDTHAPLAGSPVIDAGAEGVTITTDQRGNVRPVDGDGDGASRVDAGAVETGTPLYGTAYDGALYEIVDGELDPLTFAEWQARGFQAFTVLDSDYVKYAWSPTLYAITDIPRVDADLVEPISGAQWSRAGTPAPTTVAFVEGSVVFRWATSDELFVEAPTGEVHKLTFREWQATGPQPFEVAEDTGFIRLAWNSNIGFATDLGSTGVQGRPITAAEWASADFPTPRVANRFAGDQFTQACGSTTITYAGPTLFAQLTLAQWQAAGSPPPTRPAGC